MASSPVKGGGKDDPDQPQPDMFDDNSDRSINYQDEYEHQLADEIEYSDDEEEDGKGITLKGAAQYLQPYKPKAKEGQ